MTRERGTHRWGAKEPSPALQWVPHHAPPMRASCDNEGLTNVDGDRGAAGTHTCTGGSGNFSTVRDPRDKSLQLCCQHRPLHTLVDVEAAFIAQAPNLAGEQEGKMGNTHKDTMTWCHEWTEWPCHIPAAVRPYPVITDDTILLCRRWWLP